MNATSSTAPPETVPVVIVGGGLAGLACAVQLTSAGVGVRLFEASDRVGGRVRTDEVEGFRLDRGFQVLLNSYPEAQEQLDLDALKLHPFLPGARVRRAGAFHVLGDPKRRLGDLPATLRAPIGSFQDKLRTARLDGICERHLERPGAGPSTALELLRSAGLSDEILAAFFRPFLGGVFLDRELGASATWLAWLWGCFSRGHATLPAAGMQAIPDQLAAKLPAGTVHCGARVTSIDREGVHVEGEGLVSAEAVVVATDARSARSLAHLPDEVDWSGVTRFYFDVPADLVPGPRLVLNGDGLQDGPIHDLCMPSAVAPTYVPEALRGTRGLLGATVLGAGHDEEDLATLVTQQITRWFPRFAEDARPLRTYTIHEALPRRWDGAGLDVAPTTAWEHGPRTRGLFVCGDHRDTPSIQGALRSGKRAAQELLAARSRRLVASRPESSAKTYREG